MRKMDYKRVQIISAELAHLGYEENKQRTANLKSCLDDLSIRYSEGVGVYKNSVETCLVILPRDIGESVMIDTLVFRQFDQECTLYQDRQGESYLYYPSKKPVHIGKLREMTQVLARKQDSYTVVNNKYYAIV